MTAVLVRPTGIVVDRCDADGVWFDARELDAICAAAAERKGVRLSARAASEAGGIAMDVALTMPETVYFGAEAIGGAIVDASGNSSVAELAGDALVGASEAGSGVFESLGELLGALFD